MKEMAALGATDLNPSSQFVERESGSRGTEKMST